MSAGRVMAKRVPRPTLAEGGGSGTSWLLDAAATVAAEYTKRAFCDMVCTQIQSAPRTVDAAGGLTTRSNSPYGIEQSNARSVDR